MAFNKLIVVFLACLIFTSTFHACEAAEAAEKTAESPAEAGKFKSCFITCVEDCVASGRGRTTCEMGCDNDCTTKEEWDMVNDIIKSGKKDPAIHN